MRSPLFSLIVAAAFLGAPAAPAARAQGNKKSAGIQISFLPPPLENASFSVGIYEAKSGKLIRRLHEGATEDAFTAGLNGLITRWDGKDDAGKAVPPGRYAVRGYGVGPLEVEGLEFLGNEWTDEDEKLRIKSILAIALVPEDGGLAVVAVTPDLRLQAARFAGSEKNELRWQRTDSRLDRRAVFALPNVQLGVTADALVLGPAPTGFAYRLADGAETAATPADAQAIVDGRTSAGKDGTVWKIQEGVLGQYSAQGEQLRSLAPKENEPLPVAVAASKTADRLYLLEERPGWQRVRGLSWVESKEENGRKVSSWDTFFERSIRAEVSARGLTDPAAVKGGAPVRLELVENPLSPGKRSTAELGAVFDEQGSYLAAADGLRLRRISQQVNLNAVKLVAGKKAKTLVLYQHDGAVWEEFAITGADQMMAFDGGEIEMTANGEKPAETKDAEPPDL